MEDTNKPFISNGTTIYGKRTTLITQEIQAIRDSYTPEGIEKRLMDCARKEWFEAEHAEYWATKELKKQSTGDKKIKV